MKVKIGNIEQTLKEVKEKVIDAGGEFSGNTQSGKIYVKGVELSYKIENNVVDIQIISKPWLITEDYIYGKIKEYFI